MARRERAFMRGLTLHVTQRGNNRTATFHEPFDYEIFLLFLRFMIEHYDVQVHAYTLMSNHFHLMVTPESPTALSRGMQSLGRRYVRYFNDRYKRTGTLWEGRYRTAIISDERYWLTCLRYVEMNPVRAGLAGSADSYEWSSYRAHAFGAADPLVAPHAVYEGLASTPVRRQEAWRRICGPPVTSEQLEILRKSIADGVVVGEPFPQSRRLHLTEFVQG
jgi:putative transposase